MGFQGDLELSIREAKEVALPTLPARDWLGQVTKGYTLAHMGIAIVMSTVHVFPPELIPCVSPPTEIPRSSIPTQKNFDRLCS